MGHDFIEGHGISPIGQSDGITPRISSPALPASGIAAVVVDCDDFDVVVGLSLQVNYI